MRSGHFLLKLISTMLFTLILSIGIIGVSYSYFDSANRISFNESMGDIDVVFSSITTVQCNTTDPSCVTEALIVDGGKHIEINIENARPGDTSTIYYEVTNKGSVPVVYKLKQPSYGEDNPVQLNISENIEYIRRNGGKSQGQIVVTVIGDIDECDSYCLNTELNFQQAVVESS